MRKCKLFLFATLFVFAFNGVVLGWGTTSGDGTRFSQVQETGVFFNNSGASRSAGDVVILDVSRSGVSSGTTLGSYITVTDAAELPAQLADNVLAVGVVKATCANQTPCIVVTKGPVDTTCDDSSDAVSNYTAVGTSSATSARCGGGTNLGVALEAGDGTDGTSIFVYVQGIGTE